MWSSTSREITGYRFVALRSGAGFFWLRSVARFWISFPAVKEAGGASQEPIGERCTRAQAMQSSWERSGRRTFAWTALTLLKTLPVASKRRKTCCCLNGASAAYDASEDWRDDHVDVSVLFYCQRWMSWSQKDVNCTSSANDCRLHKSPVASAKQVVHATKGAWQTSSDRLHGEDKQRKVCIRPLVCRKEAGHGSFSLVASNLHMSNTSSDLSTLSSTDPRLHAETNILSGYAVCILSAGLQYLSRSSQWGLDLRSQGTQLSSLQYIGLHCKAITYS